MTRPADACGRGFSPDSDLDLDILASSGRIFVMATLQHRI
jgi:hypothetical protein